MNIRHLATISLGLGIVCVSASHAFAAAVLNSGDVIGDPGLLTYGGTLENHFAGTFAAAGPGSQFSGTYSVDIYSDPANLYCPGCLDFVINLKNNPTPISTDDIQSITDGAFDMNQVTVGEFGAGKTPSYVVRTSNGSGINYNYNGSNDIVPGASISAIVIQTSSTTFFPGSLAIADDVGTTVVGYGNKSSVPEPLTMGLLGGGLSLLGVMRWRRSRKS
jgi:hypothetical protein